MKRGRIISSWFVFLCAFIVSFTLISGNSRLMAQEQPGFTGHEKHSISNDLARKLISNFRAGAPQGTVLAEYFGRDAVLAMLDQPGCVGMRIYYGRNESRKPILILVGVDNYGRDIYTGIINELGSPCPPLCDTNWVVGR